MKTYGRRLIQKYFLPLDKLIRKEIEYQVKKRSNEQQIQIKRKQIDVGIKI